MTKKYDFTGKTQVLGNVILHQIVAATNFGSIRKGDVGGWIEKQSNLSHDGSAWIYNNACVLENACVYEDAKIYDNVTIYGNACIHGNSIISDNACICDNVEVYGKTHISGDALIHDNVRVYDYATVSGNALISGNSCVFNYASIDDKARLFGNVRIHGNTRICEQACVCGNAEISDNNQIFWITPAGLQNTPITFFLCGNKTIHMAWDTFDVDIHQFWKTTLARRENDVNRRVLKATIEYAKAVFLRLS